MDDCYLSGGDLTGGDLTESGAPEDRDLEHLLTMAGRSSRVRPPAALVATTKQQLHGARAIPPLVFASLALTLLSLVLLTAGALALWSLGSAWYWRAAIAGGLSCLSGTSALLVIAARNRITDFCRDLEQLVDPAPLLPENIPENTPESR